MQKCLTWFIWKIFFLILRINISETSQIHCNSFNNSWMTKSTTKIKTIIFEYLRIDSLLNVFCTLFHLILTIILIGIIFHSHFTHEKKWGKEIMLPRSEASKWYKQDLQSCFSIPKCLHFLIYLFASHSYTFFLLSIIVLFMCLLL